MYVCIYTFLESAKATIPNNFLFPSKAEIISIMLTLYLSHKHNKPLIFDNLVIANLQNCVKYKYMAQREELLGLHSVEEPEGFRMACKGKNQVLFWSEQTTEYKQCFEVRNRYKCKQRDKQERDLPNYVNWHNYANVSQVIPAEDLSLISYHFEDCFELFHQAHVYYVHLNEQTWPQAWKLSSESLFQQHDNLSKERFLIKLKYEVKGNCW